MSANVFANGREVAAKKSDDQTIAAMPDVCLTPPPPPAGPLPIPYPNFSAASDTTDGTKSVKIAGDEVGMKDQSNYKKSKGDEAATKSQGMGVVTGGIQGTTFFAAWSSDVMFEGANAVRFMDMTTHNHGSGANSGSIGKTVGGVGTGSATKTDCVKLDKENKKARKNNVDPGWDQGFTVTTSFATAPAGGTQTFGMAISNQAALKNQKDKAFAPPNKKETMACSDSKYGGPRGAKNSVENAMTRNHAEAKLIEPIFAAAGSPSAPQPMGSLLMKTFHQDACGSADAMPCDTCRPAICAAVACGLDITLCNDKNEPVKPPCENGQPAPRQQWAALGLA